jgi:DNA polymerase I-like protein with 3'-5' exonuclease and polymerase domains
MIEAFQRGDDLHRLFAAVINQIAVDLVTADQRQQAKAGTFGLLYEMGAYGFREYAETAYGVIMTMEEAARIHGAFFTMWTGMREWHNNTKIRAHRDGYVTSPLGRVRRLPGIFDANDRMVSFAERQAINSPVQSMASDLLQLALASMQGLLHESVNLPAISGVFPVGSVHDSIVAELEQKNWRGIAEEVKERMESMHTVLSKFGVDFDVPLIADYSVGTRWSWHDISDPEPEPKTLVSAGIADEFEPDN